ncbi:archease [Candidatus Woesearchaeota archaeon]|nr:archease [Candidatus Woesearchaeota archaeon]
MKYKLIDSITSDVMFEVYGKNLKELFANAAEALFSVICKIEEIEPKSEKEVELSAESIDELFIEWLQELIAMVDVEEMFFSSFVIEEINENRVLARIRGEPIIPEKGSTVVKAVTYHKFKLEKTKSGFRATVSFDI